MKYFIKYCIKVNTTRSIEIKTKIKSYGAIILWKKQENNARKTKLVVILPNMFDLTTILLKNKIIPIVIANTSNESRIINT